MPQLEEWIDPAGVPVRILAANWPERWRPYGFGLAVASILWRERRNYEIAYFLMQGFQLVTGLPIVHWAKRKSIVKFSGSGLLLEMPKSWAGRTSLRWIHNWVASILVLNPGMREECNKVGLPLERVSWMPNPVDTNHFCPASAAQHAALRNRLGMEETALVILFVGRFDPVKRIPDLLTAFAQVASSRPEAHLVLVGDGPQLEPMKNLASQLGPSKRVRFAGRQTNSEVMEWMQASNVIALVSEVEGLPVVLIEAMAVGLAPVVSRIPGNTQLVEHEVNGLVTELGNPESIANSMDRLLADASLRSRLGANARDRVLRDFSTTRVAEHYEALFDRILSS
jgi:glycosyltransferase involved in cell wall biosynthesis